MHTLKHSRSVFRHFSIRNDESYQYLQKSRIKSDFFQRSLPRLPIPKLEKTCDRYLSALKPILTQDDYQLNERVVKEFLDNPGPKLQTILKNFNQSNPNTSYITEMWFDSYLKSRQPVPINFNPALIFQNDCRNSTAFNHQIIRCTNLVISALKFYRSLSDNLLEPEVYFLTPNNDRDFYYKCMSCVPESMAWYASYLFFNAFPLDMSQYSNLFCTSRIPEFDKDRIYHNEMRQKHILVSCKGFIYKVDVMDDNGEILAPNDIYSSLLYVENQSKTKSNEYPYGVFTTTERNNWAKIRKRTEQLHEINQKIFQEIDSAIFHVALDDTFIQRGNLKLMVRNFLDGYEKTYRNRWFDKSVSLILTLDGIAGLNFEHSWGDGVAVLKFFEHIFKDSTQNPKISPDTKCVPGPKNVQQLDFVLDDSLKSQLKIVMQQYEEKCNDLDLNIVQLPGMGKDYCKGKKVSPDALTQLGFQLAYFKLYGTFVPTYESCSTAAFKHGRTETIRSCTNFTKQFCLESEKKPKKYLQELLKKCSNYHTQLAKEAAMGHGFDRHLFALKEMALRHNIKCHLFEQKAYREINENILSTSSLSSNSVWAGGFGPVIDKGFGIAYSLRNDNLGVVITNYKSQTNGIQFADKLTEAYDQLRTIL